MRGLECLTVTYRYSGAPVLCDIIVVLPKKVSLNTDKKIKVNGLIVLHKNTDEEERNLLKMSCSS